MVKPSPLPMSQDSTKDFAARKPTFQTANDIYLLPNDQQEHERLISQHKAFVALAGGKLIHIPTTVTPQKIIDVGCGTGIATRELADLYPTAKAVIGIDLSTVPDDPTDQSSPLKIKPRPNLNFVQADFVQLAGTAELSWESVDLVFSRLLVCGLTDWPGYASRAFRLLKPGGWAQMTDFCEAVYFDETISSRPKGYQPNEEWAWLKNLREGGRRKGLDVDAGKNIPDYMLAAGFVDVRVQEYRIPYWRGAVATVPEAEACVEHHIDDPWALWWHMIPRMVEDMGFSEAQIRNWQEDSRRDLGEEEGKYQAFYVTVGRKP